MKVMILGVTGMLGNTIFRFLSENSTLQVFGTSRTGVSSPFFSAHLTTQIITGVTVESHDSLINAFASVRPDVVVNCIGLVKQLAEANDPLQAVPINTLFPHRLAALCQISGARLIHFGTDCVFSGVKGNYLESDIPDGGDLYGRSKLLGEVDYPHAITLRTSIIGHEILGHRSLVNWFLAQQGSVKGFKNALFSGLPAVELARVVSDFVLPHPHLHGLYHVSAQTINKYELLRLVAQTYDKNITLIPSDELVIDRSLNATRFNEATGYVPPDWPTLVQSMYQFR